MTQPLQSFKTPRLAAESLKESHLDLLHQLHQDPKVMVTLGGLRSREVTKEFIADKIAHWAKHGYGYWIFRHQQSGDFVGRAGIQHIEIYDKPEIEIGYTVAARQWGNGYATEMATALINIAFEQLTIPALVCFTLTTNLASQRVMEKAGFVFEQEIVHKGEPHVLYRLNGYGHRCVQM